MIESPCVADNFPSPVSGKASLIRRFHYWVGWSETNYLHSVFRLETFPEIHGAVYVAARRIGQNYCDAVAVGRILPATGPASHASLIRRLAGLGADEVHLHLLARNPAETGAIVHDLRRRHEAGAIALAAA